MSTNQGGDHGMTSTATTGEHQVPGDLATMLSDVAQSLQQEPDLQETLQGIVTRQSRPLAYERASRPKPAKLVDNLRLRGIVEVDLAKKYSPEQISGRLKVEFPDQPEMQVSTETIYQSLYVQSRGALNVT